MNEVAITVKEEGTPATSYRFSRFPIRVGRSDDCQLSIRHESIARHLCTIWLEEGGAVVRVEEHPNLTNPLRCNGGVLRGGISGASIDLSCGPVQMTVESLDAPPRREQHLHSRRPVALLVASAATLAVLAAALAGSFGADDQLSAANDPPSGAPTSLPEDLPDTPFCPRDVSCVTNSECAERIRLLTTRGLELARRPGRTISEKIAAHKALSEAAALARRTGEPLMSREQRTLRQLRRRLMEGYRKEVLRYKRLSGNPSPDLAASAERLRTFLSHCAPGWSPEAKSTIDRREGGTR